MKINITLSNAKAVQYDLIYCLIRSTGQYKIYDNTAHYKQSILSHYLEF